MSLKADYDAAVAGGALRPDAEQRAAASALDALAAALKPRPFSFFARREIPHGLYIWGDVGRGKTLLMDMFFDAAPVTAKRRIHFNAFMVEVHGRIHAVRGTPGMDDPIVPVARALSREAKLLCLDEFQVTDVADAMILGRLFEQFFALGMTVVATSNTPPERLYLGGLNRQLFLPFIAQIERRMPVLTLNGPTDYRLLHMKEIAVWNTPLDIAADKAMALAWNELTGGARPVPAVLTAQGRKVTVPETARGVARLDFKAACVAPMGAADYLAIAQDFHTVMLDHVPLLTVEMRNPARRFMLLVDTLYDSGVKLVASATAPPEALFAGGYADDPLAEAFRRTVSRLVEMRSEAYLAKGHAGLRTGGADA